MYWFACIGCKYLRTTPIFDDDGKATGAYVKCKWNDLYPEDECETIYDGIDCWGNKADYLE